MPFPTVAERISNNPFIEPQLICISQSDKIHDLAEGNPGAIVCILQVIEHYLHVDVQAGMGGHHVLGFLGDNRIHGSAIVTMFHDTCKCNIMHFVAIMRGHQLGIIEAGIIRKIAADQEHSFNWPELISQIKEDLPSFNSDWVDPNPNNRKENQNG